MYLQDMKQKLSEVTNPLLPVGYTEWRQDIEQLIELSKLRTMMIVNTNIIADLVLEYRKADY